MALSKLISRRQLGLISESSFRLKYEESSLAAMSASGVKDVDCGAHEASIVDVALDDCERRYLLCGAADGSVYVHDLENFSGEPSCRSRLVGSVRRGVTRGAHERSVECVQWYPGDHGIFVTSGMDGKVKVWDANELRGRPADEYNMEGPVYCHDLCARSGAGRSQLVAVATSVNHVRLIDVRSGASSHELRGHSGAVFAVKWANIDSCSLATGSADGRVCLWDVRQARSCLRTFDYK